VWWIRASSDHAIAHRRLTKEEQTAWSHLASEGRDGLGVAGWIDDMEEDVTRRYEVEAAKRELWIREVGRHHLNARITGKTLLKLRACGRGKIRRNYRMGAFGEPGRRPVT
jgi:hypothetical protein